MQPGLSRKEKMNGTARRKGLHTVQIKQDSRGVEADKEDKDIKLIVWLIEGQCIGRNFGFKCDHSSFFLK